MDYGNTEVISLRTIVFLSHEILSLVPFAQLYCLDGVAATNSELHDQVLWTPVLPLSLIPYIKTMYCSYIAAFFIPPKNFKRTVMIMIKLYSIKNALSGNVRVQLY